jgi:hypothetical protein
MEVSNARHAFRVTNFVETEQKFWIPVLLDVLATMYGGWYDMEYSDKRYLRCLKHKYGWFEL